MRVPGHGGPARSHGHVPRQSRARSRTASASRFCGRFRAGSTSPKGATGRICAASRSAGRTTRRARATRRAASASSRAGRRRAARRDAGSRGLREDDPREPRAARVSAARRRRRRRAVARFLSRRARDAGSFDGGIQVALKALLVSPEFLFRIERDPARRRAGLALPHRRRRARVAAVLLLVEQHPRRRAARAPPSAARSHKPAELERQVRRMIADPRADAFVAQLRRPVAVSAQPRSRDPRAEHLPELRRHAARRPAARDGAVLRERAARGPQRARAARRRLHVRQRARGAALRHCRT